MKGIHGYQGRPWNRAGLIAWGAVAGLAAGAVWAADALNVAANGNVGIGTDSPSAALEIRRSDGTASIRVDERSSVNDSRTLLKLLNKGPVWIEAKDKKKGVTWAAGNKSGDFVITRYGTGSKELVIMPGGNATLAGTLTQGSDAASKQDIVPVDTQAVLAKIAGLEISEWSYRHAPEQRHVGPMAQDFHAAFGLGIDDKGISSLDTSGVALAAIQALIEENARLRERLETLERSQALTQDLVAGLMRARGEVAMRAAAD